VYIRSGSEREFSTCDAWLQQLKEKAYFALLKDTFAVLPLLMLLSSRSPAIFASIALSIKGNARTTGDRGTDTIDLVPPGGQGRSPATRLLVRSCFTTPEFYVRLRT